MHPFSDGSQAPGAVIAGVQAGHDRQQRLRGTDVTGSLFAADVLFAGLKRQPQRLVTFGIHGDADQPTRHIALEAVAGGEEGGVRPTVAERYAETLRRADDDIRVELARRLEQGQGEQIGSDHRQCTLAVRLGNGLGIVVNLTGTGGVLQQHPETIQCVEIALMMTHYHLQTERCGAGAYHIDGLRMAVLRDKESFAFRFRHAPTQGHRFRRCGRLIQQRGVGNLHAGQAHNHGLEVKQGFKPSL